MSKEKLIYIGVLVLVFAGIGAVYQFYFAAKLERYAQHQKLLTSLRDVDSKLKTTFGKAEPDDVIRDHKGKVEAWKEAITQRVPYFSDADWREHEKPPEDVFILQFWYGDETRKMVTDVWEKAQKKYDAQVLERMPDGFPNTVQPMFNVAYSEDWQGLDVKAKTINDMLARLSYGISALELLMDHNALKITQARIQEMGTSGFIQKGVNYTRLHLSFMMSMKDLVDFLEDLRRSDSFYTVEGMRIAHPYVLANYEPQLQIDMFLTRARPKQDYNLDTILGAQSAADVYDGSVATGLSGMTISGGRNAVDGEEGVAAEPGTFGKAWKWFKRTVLYTN